MSNKKLLRKLLEEAKVNDCKTCLKCYNPLIENIFSMGSSWHCRKCGISWFKVKYD
jgi:ribosomal protein L37AE/L43A